MISAPCFDVRMGLNSDRRKKAAVYWRRRRSLIKILNRPGRYRRKEHVKRRSKQSVIMFVAGGTLNALYQFRREAICSVSVHRDARFLGNFLGDNMKISLGFRRCVFQVISLIFQRKTTFFHNFSDISLRLGAEIYPCNIVCCFRLSEYSGNVSVPPASQYPNIQLIKSKGNKVDSLKYLLPNIGNKLSRGSEE